MVVSRSSELRCGRHKIIVCETYVYCKSFTGWAPILHWPTLTYRCMGYVLSVCILVVIPVHRSTCTLQTNFGDSGWQTCSMFFSENVILCVHMHYILYHKMNFVEKVHHLVTNIFDANSKESCKTVSPNDVKAATLAPSSQESFKCMDIAVGCAYDSWFTRA